MQAHLPPPSHAHPLDVLARASRAAAWVTSSAAGAALSAGASNVDSESLGGEKRRAEAATSALVASDSNANGAAVATPVASSSASSLSKLVGIETVAPPRSGGDGYATPPLQAAVAAALDEHVVAAPPIESTPPAAHSSPPRSAHPPTIEQHAQDADASASLSSSSAVLFTPILFAAASPLGGILSPTGNKRKRMDSKQQKARGANGKSAGRKGATGSSASKAASAPRKRKGSSDFLRKGQWTATEEKFTRALLDAFSAGYLPIFSGVRLRGYLAVQLQCDPMRISKKLCGGTVDGKKVPKNYGQMKYKMRKQHLWDEQEAARILVELERLMRDLWGETGIARPRYLSLSSTRSSSDDSVVEASRGSRCASSSPSAAECTRTEWLSDGELSSSSSSSSNSLVPTHATPDSSAFPIIYLNLAKKHKPNGGAAAAAPATWNGASASTAARRSDSGGRASSKKPARVDGDSLQAAYDLLNLLQAPPDEAAA